MYHTYWRALSRRHTHTYTHVRDIYTLTPTARHLPTIRLSRIYIIYEHDCVNLVGSVGNFGYRSQYRRRAGPSRLPPLHDTACWPIFFTVSLKKFDFSVPVFLPRRHSRATRR